MSTIHRGRRDWDLCPSEKTLKITGFIIVVALLSINIWVSINGCGSSQTSSPFKTFTAEEVAKLTEKAVQNEREEHFHDRHRYSEERDDGLPVEHAPAKVEEKEFGIIANSGCAGGRGEGGDSYGDILKESGAEASARVTCVSGVSEGGAVTNAKDAKISGGDSDSVAYDSDKV